MFLEDPRGIGARQYVNAEGFALIVGPTFDFQHHVCHQHGQTYSFLFSVTPTGANDCFLYMKNTDDDDIVVTSLKCKATTTDEEITVKLGDTGTPAGTSTATPANRNGLYGANASGTFYTGNDITGLSGGTSIDYITIDADVGTEKFSWGSAIIVPKNQVFTLYATTGGIALKGSLSFYYHTCACA